MRHPRRTATEPDNSLLATTARRGLSKAGETETRGQKSNPDIQSQAQLSTSPALAAHLLPVLQALKYLNAGDGRDLFLQEIHPGSEFLSD